MFSKNKCSHKWKFMSKKFNPSQANEIKGRPPTDLAKFALFGITNITPKCEICGLLCVIEAAGDVSINESGEN